VLIHRLCCVIQKKKLYQINCVINYNDEVESFFKIFSERGFRLKMETLYVEYLLSWTILYEVPCVRIKKQKNLLHYFDEYSFIDKVY